MDMYHMFKAQMYHFPALKSSKLPHLLMTSLDGRCQSENARNNIINNKPLRMINIKFKMQKYLPFTA
jgi:hypothetical protein